MTKQELLNKLANVDDDAQLFVVSSEYDFDDDATWIAETQAEIKDTMVINDDVFIVIDCNTFE